MAAWATKSTRSQLREIDQLHDQLRLEQSRQAALQIQLARLTDMQVREMSTPEPLRSLPRLTSSSLIDAAVLGEAVAESWRAGKLLNRGDANGVRESSLVVQSRHPLVDLGRDGELSPEDGLLLGRCVIGKIERVSGRWTSTFILLTDSEYRGRGATGPSNRIGIRIWSQRDSEGAGDVEVSSGGDRDVGRGGHRRCRLHDESRWFAGDSAVLRSRDRSDTGCG